MLWTLEALAAATSGVVAAPGGQLTGVSIDTRTLRPGELFVAIRAGRDGHEFVDDAVRAGAGGLLVEAGRPLPGRSSSGTGGVPDPAVGVLAVADTGRALLEVGRAARRRLGGPVVAITGSVGKTSTKDLCAAAVGAARRTVSSPQSFNNELGVPLTLANAPADCEVAVIEMGARGPGHIRLLCDVARPSVGVVTAVAAVHTETFGDIDGVARAKRELVEALPASGTAVLNGDDPRVRAMAGAGPATPLLYSVASPPWPGAAIVAEEVEVDGELRPSFSVRSPWGRVEVRLEARGAHQVGNALAALGVAGAVGVPLSSAAEALAQAPVSAWRMDLRRSRSGALILNDAYNANPASMAAALRALASLAVPRRVAVLGVMAELGSGSAASHAEVAELALSLGVEVIAVGTDAYGVGGVSPEQTLALLGVLGSDLGVLVKGSRVAGLEKLAARLLEA